MNVIVYEVAKVVTSHYKHLKLKAMKPGFLLLAVAVAGLSSCATYRSGQTPDDVYYSPARPAGETYVQTDRDEDGRTTYNDQSLEDERLRQQIRNQRFRNFDDDFYWNNPYLNQSFRYNNFNTWNSWNNPWHANTWGTGWNTWSLGWNNWNSWNSWGWSSWNSPFVCIPGSNIIIPGPGAPKNSTGIRYSPGVQNYNNASTRGNFNGGKGGTYGGSNGGSRYFGGANNNNGGRRSNSFFNDFFGGGSNNSSGGSYNNSGGGSRSFGNGGSSGGGSRTFGGSSSGGSSGGGSRSSGSTGGTGGRRN
jgi:hypothetical protein